MELGGTTMFFLRPQFGYVAIPLLLGALWIVDMVDIHNPLNLWMWIECLVDWMSGWWIVDWIAWISRTS